MSQKNTAIKICKAVELAGGEAWYVGGYVRDKLIAEILPDERMVEPNDIDLEIYGLEEDKIPGVLKEAGVNVIKVGRQFPVWKTENGVDISMPREERGNGKDHAKYIELNYAPDLPVEKALERRDFTINTFMKKGGTYGGKMVSCEMALSDLENRIIRHQNEKFSEDPLRVFRAARFAAQLGFTIAPETDELCRTMDTRKLSKERVAEETNKAIMSDKPSRYFEALKGWAAFRDWFPELALCIGVGQPREWHPEGDVFTHTMMALDYAAEHHMPYITRLAVLCHDLGKPLTKIYKDGQIKFPYHGEEGAKVAQTLLTRLCVPVQMKKHILPAVREHMRVYDLEDGKHDYKHYNKLFDMVDAALLVELTECDRNGTTKIAPDHDVGFTHTRAAFRHYINYKRDKYSQEVSANDLMLEGHKPSPAFRPALELAHKIWLKEIPKNQALPMVLGSLRKEERRIK